MPPAPGSHGPYTDSGPAGGFGLDSSIMVDAPIAVYAIDMTGNVCFWNGAAEDLLGWRAADIVGTPPPFIDADEADRARDLFERVLRSDGVVHEAYFARHSDGRRLDVRVETSLLRNEAGEPTVQLGVARDVTAATSADRKARADEHTWRQLAMHSADTITIADAGAKVLESTGEVRPVFGYPLNWWRGQDGAALVHPDEVQRATEAWAGLLAFPGARHRDLYRARHRDGYYLQVELTGINMLDDPVIGGIVIASANVSAHKQAESLVADEARVFELIARNAPLADTLAEIVRILEFHSGGSVAIFLTEESAEAESTDANAESTDADAQASLRLAAAGSLTPHLTDLARHQVHRGRNAHPGPADPAELSVDALTDDECACLWTMPIIEQRTQNLYGVAATFVADPRGPTDHEQVVLGIAARLAAVAVERAASQHDLWQRARYDQLTNLPNRWLLLETLDAALTQVRVVLAPVAIMMIDLDRFKLINDSLGYAAGDQLIRGFADRLRQVLDPEDFVGRMAADEFVVILPAGQRADDAQRLAERVTDALDQPFGLDGSRIFLTASIGISVSEAGRQNADTLLQQADAAMFRAKHLGRDRVEIFDERLRTRAVKRLEIDRDLRVALERSELLVYYQPEIDCRTGRIVGAEALLRWLHPERGLIQPDAFITVAEESGIIVPIGRWVLDEAVRQARAWTDAYPFIDPFHVSVNLSARQLMNRSLVDGVAFALTRYDWPPSRLTLELTESILIEDRDATHFVLNRLRLLGVRLAIDDFGTGFASLDYLLRLHVDVIKIDRSFVSMLEAEGTGSPVATAMMHMARAFEVKVTAEGVEETHQFAGLKAIGCDIAQGFLFARPLPAEQMGELLRANPCW